jgi:hypothetical protein
VSEQLKVYIASIVASSSLAVEGVETTTVTMHVPLLVPARSMTEASERCREQALERWPISEGWYGHQAAIIPVTQEFYRHAFEAHGAGVVDLSEDEQQGEVVDLS